MEIGNFHVKNVMSIFVFYENKRINVNNVRLVIILMENKRKLDFVLMEKLNINVKNMSRRLDFSEKESIIMEIQQMII